MKSLQRIEAQTKMLELLSRLNKSGGKLPRYVRERFDLVEKKWIWEYFSVNMPNSQPISEIARYL